MGFLIFDIGSNATKASWVNENNEILKDWRIVTKLGKHLQSDGFMELTAVQNNILSILDIIQDVSRRTKENISHHCIGTEALRKAANRGKIQEMFKASGLKLDILTPDEEAMYERIGIAHSKAVKMLPQSPFLLVDSGGSSTECSIVLPNGDVPYAHSFSFGQHKLIDMIQHQSEDVLSEMISVLTDMIHVHRFEYVIASGSSFTTYAMETLKIQIPGDVEGRRVMPDLSVEQPASQAGQLLVNRLTQCLHLPVYVSTYGIRHGWIFDKFSNHHS